MPRLTTLAALTALGLAAGAEAQEATTFDIDRDPDGRASYESFNRAFDEAGLFDAWDADRDGMLTREEVNRGVFVLYDSDADDFLTGDEADRLIDEWDAPVKAGLHGTAQDSNDPDAPAN